MPTPGQRPRVPRAIDPSRTRREERIGWQMAALGMQVSSEVIAGVLLGYLADYLLETTNRMGVLIGGCVGIVVGLATLIRTGWKLNNQMEREEALRRKGATPASGEPTPRRPSDPPSSDPSAGSGTSR